MKNSAKQEPKILVRKVSLHCCVWLLPINTIRMSGATRFQQNERSFYCRKQKNQVCYEIWQKKNWKKIFAFFRQIVNYHWFRWILANHVRLGGQILKAIRELYQKIACDKSVIRNGILSRIITHLNPFWVNSVSCSNLFSLFNLNV